MEIRNYIRKHYKLKFSRHEDEIGKIEEYLRREYKLKCDKLNLIKDLLESLQMAYWGTDDILDEGEKLRRRIDELLQIHLGLNEFYSKLFKNFPIEIVQRVLEVYDKAFSEMLEVPLKLNELITDLYSGKSDIYSSLKEIMLERAKHVTLYWGVALSIVEKDSKTVEKIMSIKHLERALSLFEKDWRDRDNDKKRNEFNIYNFLEFKSMSFSVVEKIKEDIKKELDYTL